MRLFTRKYGVHYKFVHVPMKTTRDATHVPICAKLHWVSAQIQHFFVTVRFDMRNSYRSKNKNTFRHVCSSENKRQIISGHDNSGVYCKTSLHSSDVRHLFVCRLVRYLNHLMRHFRSSFVWMPFVWKTENEGGVTVVAVETGGDWIQTKTCVHNHNQLTFHWGLALCRDSFYISQTAHSKYIHSSTLFKSNFEVLY